MSKISAMDPALRKCHAHTHCFISQRIYNVNFSSLKYVCKKALSPGVSQNSHLLLKTFKKMQIFLQHSNKPYFWFLVSFLFGCKCVLDKLLPSLSLIQFVGQMRAPKNSKANKFLQRSDAKENHSDIGLLGSVLNANGHTECQHIKKKKHCDI